MLNNVNTESTGSAYLVDIPGRTVEAMNAANLRKDVAEVATEVHKLGNEIHASFNDQTKDRADFSRLVLKEFCDSGKMIDGQFSNLNNRLCDSEKELLITRHLLSKEILENTIKIKDQMTDFHHCMDKNFCHTNSEALKNTQNIIDRLAADKLDEKNDIIAQLRAKQDRLEDNIHFGDNLTAIKSQIWELNQNQKATQQTIQFGQGNLAGQSNTNNQVR